MIPRKLKIGGYDYEIIDEKQGLADNGRFGYHNRNRNEIGIDPDCSEELKMSTLLHEILEAVNWHYDMKLKHDQICKLETTLFQVLKDNKLTF